MKKLSISGKFIFRIFCSVYLLASFFSPKSIKTTHVNEEQVVAMVDFEDKFKYLIGLINTTSPDAKDDDSGFSVVEHSLGDQYLRFKPRLDEQVTDTFLKGVIKL